ncbi:hypothetical protein CCAX7_005450 [Capsulimonas corticalis]|uniref:Uncharacterized protein n=1 Tax=Capsulimonas corticalis TaxID=2219043 RepID=A0A402D385_9BACT|nr:hypothetical protein [Capsulimonas corticalis]BDI28494.1 hypothetical protein CCAX7_005450 [Capsulimonas corticalis]
MERKLHQEPVYDIEALRTQADSWKARSATRAIVEWSTGTGPTIFVFPEGERRFGVKWTAAVEAANYNELYADYIEQKLLPVVLEAVRARGLEAIARCVDLQPLQVQRQRRRQIERAQNAVAHH